MKQHKAFDIAIVGGGLSGLIAALAAAPEPAIRRALPGDYHPHDVGFRCAADPKAP